MNATSIAAVTFLMIVIGVGVGIVIGVGVDHPTMHYNGVLRLSAIAVVVTAGIILGAILIHSKETSSGNNITQPENSSAAAPMPSIPVVPRSVSNLPENRLPRYCEIVLEDLPPTYDEIAQSKQEINVSHGSSSRQSDTNQNKVMETHL